jgi:putative tryptophan/tyrosine transport system substrate-binding protein
MHSADESSLPGLTRQSITLRKNLRKKMDARVEPAHVEGMGGTPTMKRRAFVTLLGGALALTALPRVTRAQAPAMPVIGLLDTRAAATTAERLRGFHRGLKESGYVEGENVAILYRWAEGQTDRIPELAAELVHRKVAVIAATGGSPAALASKAATATIPVVFAVPEDPVKLGLVASLARPGGHMTGINFFNAEVAAKRLELLRQLVPAATRLAVLVNPTNIANTEANLRELQPAARAIGLHIQVVHARTSREIDTAFAAMAHERPDVLFVSGDSLFNSRRMQLALMAARYAIPAAYSSRDYPASGGLMSYGADVTDAFRQVGAYTGRILNGAKPADLPVVQSSKFELVINQQAAHVLGLTVPPSLLSIADEVIE